jgi:hypothetical protein
MYPQFRKYSDQVAGAGFVDDMAELIRISGYKKGQRSYTYQIFRCRTTKRVGLGTLALNAAQVIQ